MKKRKALFGIATLLAVVVALSWFHDSRFPAQARANSRMASDRIFAATSYPGGVLPVFEITSGNPVEFARLNAGGWIGPLVVRGDGRLFAVTNANNGSLYDITDGGDLTNAPPLASNLFPGSLSFLEGLAFDGDGNAYISNSEAGIQQIAVVGPDGSVSYLAGQYNNAVSLVVQGSILYIGEGGAGRVLAFDLASGQATEFATGFQAGGSHVAASLAVDPRGHLLVLWGNGLGHGLFDITPGGDFSQQPPVGQPPFGFDVNQIAVDSANNVYAAGDGNGSAYISPFDGTSFGPFVPFANGLGDTESIVVVTP